MEQQPWSSSAFCILIRGPKRAQTGTFCLRNSVPRCPFQLVAVCIVPVEEKSVKLISAHKCENVQMNHIFSCTCGLYSFVPKLDISIQKVSYLYLPYMKHFSMYVHTVQCMFEMCFESELALSRHKKNR